MRLCFQCDECKALHGDVDACRKCDHKFKGEVLAAFNGHTWGGYSRQKLFVEDMIGVVTQMFETQHRARK